MIIINSEKDIENLSFSIRPVIKFWWNRLNSDDPQMNTYFSDFPIGSLGEVWIAENEKEVLEKDFIEMIQVNLKNIILFIGTWIPTDGNSCADIFIPSPVLSENLLNQFITQSDEVIEIESI